MVSMTLTDATTTRVWSTLAVLGLSMATGCADSSDASMSPQPSGASGSSAQPAPRSLCSGCPEDETDPMDATIHLHHIHMNVRDREASTRFYQKFLSAERVELNDVADALYAAPTMLLLDESEEAPDASLPTALQHVGWGSADVGAWYDMAGAEGVVVDTRGHTLFGTPPTPTIGEPGTGGDFLTGAPSCFPRQDAFSFVYVMGPDDERIEVWSGADQRVNHVHFTTPDVIATGNWYRRFLGVGDEPTSTIAHTLYLDDVNVFFEAIGTPADYQPTDDHVLGHIAFSVTDLEAWMQRATDQSIEIVKPPAETHGFTSFFVRGPDGMLIELVQASPHGALCPAQPGP